MGVCKNTKILTFNKKVEITLEERAHCLCGRGPLPNFLPLSWTRFADYGASDTGTRNWGRGSQIIACIHINICARTHTHTREHDKGHDQH